MNTQLVYLLKKKKKKVAAIRNQGILGNVKLRGFKGKM